MSAKGTCIHTIVFCVPSVQGNPIRPSGDRAIARAIAANEDTALLHLSGVRLCEYLNLLEVPDEFRQEENDPILAHLRELRSAYKVKSARGGVTEHKHT
jgi:hypothetical protein